MSPCRRATIIIGASLKLRNSELPTSTDDQRLRVFKWLEILGRWSMLDVFVVAMIVVIAKSGGALKASPKIGIYLFAIAVLLSLVVTVHIRSLARRVSPKARRVLADV